MLNGLNNLLSFPQQLTTVTDKFIGVRYLIWCVGCYLRLIALRRKATPMFTINYTGLNKPLELQKVGAPWIFKQSAHKGGKDVSPMHRPPLPLKIYSWYSFPLGATVCPEGLSQWKIPTTPPGNEPVTLWLVAQCLNQLRHHVTTTIKRE